MMAAASSTAITRGLAPASSELGREEGDGAGAPDGGDGELALCFAGSLLRPVGRLAPVGWRRTPASAGVTSGPATAVRHLPRPAAADGADAGGTAQLRDRVEAHEEAAAGEAPGLGHLRLHAWRSWRCCWRGSGTGLCSCWAPWSR